ncbi:hypothetical protein REPUB_Repub10bG0067500 [Reevesia pubescens]
MHGKDRISNLPDSVLLHILSFLPAKDAVKTALIAHRFRHIWEYLRTLSFDFCRFHNCETKTYADGPEYNENFLDLVNNLLLRHKGKTIDEFHLNLELNFCHTMNECTCDDPDHDEFVVREKRMANAVSTWLFSAIRKKVQVLHLDFIGCGLSERNANYILPNLVFLSGECLRELKLAACEIKPRAKVQFRSLKKLWLYEVVLNDNIMDQILFGCSVLEELSVLDCYGLSRLAFRNPSVKSLVVNVWYAFPRLAIRCPNIVSLDLFGNIENVDLVDVSSVNCASLFCDDGSQCELFACLKVCTTLQLADLCFEWKYLDLKLVKIKWSHPGISYLLRSSPLLETLDMYICPKWPDTVKYNEAQYLDNGEVWGSQEDTFHCLEHHLKTVRLYGDVTKPHVIEFVDFLLKNAMVLEKLVISTKKTFQPTQRQHAFSSAVAYQKDALSIEKRLEVCQKLCISPRASRYAMIHFS